VFLSFIGACGLFLVLFFMGVLVSQRKLSWYLPFAASLVVLALIIVPSYLLHISLPDIAKSDMDSASEFTTENMPEDGAGLLLDNSTHGSSFDYAFYSLIPIAISALLLVGIKRRPLPSLIKVASDFYSPENDREFEVYDGNKDRG
jgi:hypothetical protein